MIPSPPSFPAQEQEIDEKNELVAQLKDHRQETRVRTQMERSYVEHDSKMQLQMARKQRELDRTVRARGAVQRPGRERCGQGRLRARSPGRLLPCPDA